MNFKKMNFKKNLLLLAAASISLPAFAGAQVSVSKDYPPVVFYSERGESLYNSRCGICHGFDGMLPSPAFYNGGKKKFLPPFDDPRIEKPAPLALPSYEITGSRFLEKVRKGGYNMPPFSHFELNDMDVGYIIFYINHMKRENASRGEK